MAYDKMHQVEMPQYGNISHKLKSKYLKKEREMHSASVLKTLESFDTEHLLLINLIHLYDVPRKLGKCQVCHGF